jgi:ppGpp synthetase/RelA/SpoT-type nucleotidyltranferase
MADFRTVEDVLREEYFALLPDVRRALIETETRTRAALLDVSLATKRYERIVVTARVKECDTAIDSLRRRQPLGRFETDRDYTLTSLRDLAAVRIMAFPYQRLKDCERALAPMLSGWTPDPVPHVIELDAPLALKYYGKWNSTARISSEIQIVPLLVGLFWEVEHSAIYKPTPNLRGVVGLSTVLEKRNNVLVALRDFETEFEAAIRAAENT